MHTPLCLLSTSSWRYPGASGPAKYMPVLVMRGELWLRRLMLGESHPAMLAIGESMFSSNISILYHIEITASS